MYLSKNVLCFDVVTSTHRTIVVFPQNVFIHHVAPLCRKLHQEVLEELFPRLQSVLKKTQGLETRGVVFESVVGVCIVRNQLPR